MRKRLLGYACIKLFSAHMLFIIMYKISLCDIYSFTDDVMIKQKYVRATLADKHFQALFVPTNNHWHLSLEAFINLIIVKRFSCPIIYK